MGLRGPPLQALGFKSLILFVVVILEIELLAGDQHKDPVEISIGILPITLHGSQALLPAI